MTDKQPSNQVPKLRFPEFRHSGEWEKKRLCDFGTIISGLTYSPNDVRDGELLVLRSSNIQNGKIALDDCVYVRHDMNGANLTQPDDILICVRNGSRSLIGKNAIVPKGMPICTHGAFMAVFRTSTPHFARVLLQTAAFQNQVAADLGATINSINKSQLLNYRFTVPKPTEQQKIADCLGSLDDLLAAKERKLEALRQHKQGLMQQLFPKLGETQPFLRLAEFRNAPGWVQTSLGDAFSKITNGQANVQDHQDDGAYPLFDRSEIVKRSSTFQFDAEAVILPGEGMRFQPRYFKGKFNLHQRAYALMEPKIDPRFAFHALDRFKGALADNAVKSTVLSLRMPIIEKFNIPCPTIYEEQKSIADCLYSLDDLIKAEIQKLEFLRQHKKGLMQQLFPSLQEESR